MIAVKLELRAKRHSEQLFAANTAAISAPPPRLFLK